MNELVKYHQIIRNSQRKAFLAIAKSVIAYTAGQAACIFKIPIPYFGSQTCPLCSSERNYVPKYYIPNGISQVCNLLCNNCSPHFTGYLALALKEFIQIKLIIGEICGQREICDVSPHIFSLFVDSHK
jgi:hypothetical protein